MARWTIEPVWIGTPDRPARSLITKRLRYPNSFRSTQKQSVNEQRYYNDLQLAYLVQQSSWKVFVFLSATFHPGNWGCQLFSNTALDCHFKHKWARCGVVIEQTKRIHFIAVNGSNIIQTNLKHYIFTATTTMFQTPTSGYLQQPISNLLNVDCPKT